MVAKHVNKKTAGKPRVLVINALLYTLTCCSCCNLQCYAGFLLLPFNDVKPPLTWILREFDVSHIRPRLGGLPHLETFTYQNLTPVERVTRSGRPGYLPWRVNTYYVNVIKLKWEIIWSGGLPHLSGYYTYLGSPPPCQQAQIKAWTVINHDYHNYISCLELVL